MKTSRLDQSSITVISFKMDQVMDLSTDQKQCVEKIKEHLTESGVDFLTQDHRSFAQSKFSKNPMIVLGRAGSGKTIILRELTKILKDAKFRTSNLDFDHKNKMNYRHFCVLAPTNKAVSVLRLLGISAVTLHRALYMPVYDPEYEKIAQWLKSEVQPLPPSLLGSEKLEKMKAFFEKTPSIPGALASVGVRGSDFISGWTRRESPLDVGIIDESSMLNDSQLKDLQKIFKSLILFGDPGQLAPVEQSGNMSFNKLKNNNRFILKKIHRQVADNPILRLAKELEEPDLTFLEFENRLSDLSRIDDRVQLKSSVNPKLMNKSPVLVWRNQTRIRLISAFRKVYNAPHDDLIEGEPLICDGIELPLKHRKRRIELEERGLIKGAQVIYLGKGKKIGFSRVYVVGTAEPLVSVASIIQIENLEKEEPDILSAAGMGVIFLHGSAVTIHKSQGSQWDQIQVFGPDIEACERSKRIEAGIPLWKRLAYVAITRSTDKLFWITRYRLEDPKEGIILPDFIKSNLDLLTSPQASV